MLKIGEIQQMSILRETGSGLFLGNEEGDDVLLPFKYAPPGFEIDDVIDAFIYKDDQNRPIATTKTPLLTVGKFGYLKVSSVVAIGAFVDIGVDKDLLIPFREQAKRMIAGRNYVIHMFIDKVSGRMVGSALINKFVKPVVSGLKTGDEVEILIYEKTELGYNAIVNQQFRGLLYHSEIFEPMPIGFSRNAFVKQIRPDNRIDLLLRKPGHEHIDESAEDLLEAIKYYKGFLPLHDKSTPEEISKVMGMSKKTFKKAVGSLYKARLITLKEDGIHLVE
ncbi:MAG: GntR family transcriptional regulator [Saprospiraceae bacterium]|nr:GntR family transcriptional regulator [Saprospiraceae bacterium]